MQFMAQCKGNKKTVHLTYHLIKRAEYLEKFELNLARIVFKAKVRISSKERANFNYFSKLYSTVFCTGRFRRSKFIEISWNKSENKELV